MAERMRRSHCDDRQETGDSRVVHASDDAARGDKEADSCKIHGRLRCSTAAAFRLIDRTLFNTTQVARNQAVVPRPSSPILPLAVSSK